MRRAAQSCSIAYPGIVAALTGRAGAPHGSIGSSRPPPRPAGRVRTSQRPRSTQRQRSSEQARRACNGLQIRCKAAELPRKARSFDAGWADSLGRSDGRDAGQLAAGGQR